MAKAKLYTDGQIEKARKILSGLESKSHGRTRKEAGQLLANEIRRAIKRGYSIYEIRDIMEHTGIPVSLAQIQELAQTPAGTVDNGSTGNG